MEFWMLIDQVELSLTGLNPGRAASFFNWTKSCPDCSNSFCAVSEVRQPCTLLLETTLSSLGNICSEPNQEYRTTALRNPAISVERTIMTPEAPSSATA